MLQTSLQSAWQITDAPILGIQSIKNYLYIFQSSKISVFQSISENMSLSLSEQIHLQNPIINYSCNQKYIGIITSNSVQVRSRNHWQNVIYYINNSNTSKKIKEISLRDQQIILQFVDQVKNSGKVFLQIINLSQIKQFQGQSEFNQLILPGLQHHQHSQQDLTKRLDHRLITIDYIGKVNDVYVYQTGKGTVQTGIFIQLSNTKKKAFKIGSLTSLSQANVRCMYRHQTTLQGSESKPQYILLITQWEDRKSIDVVIHQIWPPQQSGQKKTRDKYRDKIIEKSKRLGQSPTLLEEMLKQFEEQEQREAALKSQIQSNLIPLFKGQVYVNSFYQNGILYVCTQNQEMRINLKNKIAFGDKIIDKIDKWPKLQPMVGVHQGKPIYEMHSLIQGKIVKNQNNGKIQIQIETDGLITKNQKIISSKEPTQQQKEFDTFFIRKQGFPKIFDSKSIIAQKKNTINEYENDQIESSVSVNSSETQSTNKKNSHKNQKSQTNIPNNHDYGVQNSFKSFQKYVQVNPLDILLTNQAQTGQIYMSNQETQTQVSLSCHLTNQQTQISQQCQPQAVKKMEKYKESLKIDNKKNSPKNKQAQNKINLSYQQKQNCQKIISVNTEGVMTDFQLFESLIFPKQKFISQITKTLSDFRQNFEQSFLSNITLLNKANNDAKNHNEQTLKAIASQISKLGIDEQIKSCILPIIKENMKKIVDQVRSIFNNGLANVKIQSEQIGITQNTIIKLIEQQQYLANGMKKSVGQMIDMLKQKELHNNALIQSLKNQVKQLKEIVLAIQTKLTQRISKESQIQDNILKGFQQLNSLSVALQKQLEEQKREEQRKNSEQSHQIQQQNQLSSSQSEEQSSQESLEEGRKLPSIKGSFINSQSPSVFAYNNIPQYAPNPYQYPIIQNQPSQFYQPSNYMQPMGFQNYPHQSHPQMGYPIMQPQGFMYSQHSQTTKSQKKKKKDKKK